MISASTFQLNTLPLISSILLTAILKKKKNKIIDRDLIETSKKLM